MEKNFLREFKGYKIYESQASENGPVNERRLEVEDTAISFLFDNSDSAALNKVIEAAKSQIRNLAKSETKDQPAEETPVRKCRVCGCTEDNCEQCVKKTGKPCFWVEQDLCSACVAIQEIPVVDTRASQENGGSQQFYPVAQDPKNNVKLKTYKTFSFYDSGPSNTDEGKRILTINLSPSEILHSIYFDDASEESLKYAFTEAEAWADQYYEAKAPRTPADDSMFFQHLALLGNVDITMRIMKVNGKFTMEIRPSNQAKNFKPINITGAPEEFDKEFFSVIMPSYQEIAGLQHNIKEVKEAATKTPAKKSPVKKKASRPPVKKPVPAKKEDKKAAVIKKPVPSDKVKKQIDKAKSKVEKKKEDKAPAVVETSLFDQPEEVVEQ